MKLRALSFSGVWMIIPDRTKDHRGFFERTYCKREFVEHNLNANFIESGVSYNNLKGTVRGLHFQWLPAAQAKMVRCIHGAIQDILLDLRPSSSTFMDHIQVTLDAWSNTAVYIPEGFAHGFQTLTDEARVEYHMTHEHSHELSGGCRWDDPAFGIKLPLAVTNIAERDKSYPNFQSYLHAKNYRRSAE